MFESRNNFLIVSFDGLRPDLISRQLTPNICRVQNSGVTLAKHRTVYPSETRVAFPSLVTGSTPDWHGMIGNKFVDRSVLPERYIDTSSATLLATLDAESGGHLMTAPTLGELLGAGGQSLAVLATNTPGTTRLFHHKAEKFNHVRLSGHFREACTPENVLSEAEERFGSLPPVPPQGEPDLDAQQLIVSVFLDLVWPRIQPDVTILSFGEPDTCSHFNGTGAEKTREVIAYCDLQLGRLVDWWELEGRAAGVQLLVISDHGHITGHTKVSVTDCLRSAGFSPSDAPGPGVDAVVVPGQVGAIYLKDRSPDVVDKVVDVITSQPWCGCTFTAPRNEREGIARGTFGTNIVNTAHERTPDVCFSFRTDDSVDPYGLIGGTFYDNNRRSGLGLHGGLHPRELSAVGIAAGSAFRGEGIVSSVPSGICDVVPTIMHLLDLNRPPDMSGRVLREVLAEDMTPDVPAIETLIFETRRNSYVQSVQRTKVGNTIYIDGGWVGASPAWSGTRSNGGLS